MLLQSSRRRTTWFLVGALLMLLGCSADFGFLLPKQSSMRPPYLAVVVFVDAPPEVVTRGPYTFRIRELSGTLGVDTTVRASPKDTIIIPVQPATYRIDISDVPSTCGVREGTAQSVVVPERSNTSLARFFINCSPALVVAAYTDGFAPDSDYVLTVQGGTSAPVSQAYLVKANDTTRIETIKPGTYTVALHHVAANCVITSDGGEQIATQITPAGGVFIAFRVICSEAARRPRIVQAVASYGGGSLAYIVRAVDPDKDIERTFVDVTDCNRKSVLPGGGLRRGGFSGYPNVTGKDTAVIIGAYDLPVSDDVLRNKCIAIWVADERGNTSEFAELPLKPRDAASSPTATTFNARLNGTTTLQAQLTVSDPNNDYVGVFGVYVTRDGIVALPMDGQPDRLVLAPAGIIGAMVPDLRLGIGLGEWNDYLSFVVYLVDRAGNFTRVEDNDLFR